MTTDQNNPFQMLLRQIMQIMRSCFNMPEVLEISIRPIRVANSFGLEKNSPKTFETTKDIRTDK